jgi:threonine dehydrogenase-like Zn-dependent dehydrogenase
VAGRRLHCERSAFIGLHADGGLADYLTVPAAMCVGVPTGVPDRVAVLTEPLAVAVRAVRRAGLSALERVMLVGGGTIGQCVAQLALTRTPDVGLFELDEAKVAATRDAVPALAATVTGPPEHPWTGRTDCVLDCAGSVASFEAALRLVRPGGRVVLVGAAAQVPSFSPHDLLVREVTLRTTFSHDRERDTRVAMELLGDGSLRLDHVVTGVVPLDEVVDRVVHRPEPTGFKVVAQP